MTRFQHSYFLVVACLASLTHGCGEAQPHPAFTLPQFDTAQELTVKSFERQIENIEPMNSELDRRATQQLRDALKVVRSANPDDLRDPISVYAVLYQSSVPDEAGWLDVQWVEYGYQVDGIVLKQGTDIVARTHGWDGTIYNTSFEEAGYTEVLHRSGGFPVLLDTGGETETALIRKETFLK
jgi:hypothetical protein